MIPVFSSPVVLLGTSADPHFNLAAEEVLLDMVGPSGVILYLWQNANTVVIGRNQNAYTECNLRNMEADGATLARRMTGGGAVYHDGGNLNFSFVAGKAVYDVSRHQEVILGAMRKLGLEAELSGRNDLTISGRKFSGNAFLHRAETSLHHGTILVHTDTERMARYLNPAPEKLAGKGVKSVRSRVVNLAELDDTITVQRAISAFIESFSEIYGNPAEMAMSELPQETLAGLTKRNREPEFNLGDNVRYSVQCTAVFSWGFADVRAEMERETITRVRIYSDSLDAELAGRLEEELMGRNLYDCEDGPTGEVLKLLAGRK